MFGLSRQHNLSLATYDPRYSGDVLRIGRVARHWPETMADLDSLPVCVSAMVAMWGGHAVGYVFCDLTLQSCELVHLVVHPSCREVGIGRALMEAMVSKAAMIGRRRLEYMAHEADLPAQIFLRSCGFRAVRVCKGAFRAVGDDADGYRFVRDLTLVECAGK